MIAKVTTMALIVGLVLTVSPGAQAAQKKAAKAPKAATHSAQGTITSIDANQLVITQKVQGQDKPVSFVLNSATQKSGDLASGNPVTVRYKTENNQNVATSVRARPVKAAKGTKPKGEKKSLTGKKG